MGNRKRPPQKKTCSTGSDALFAKSDSKGGASAGEASSYSSVTGEPSMEKYEEEVTPNIKSDCGSGADESGHDAINKGVKSEPSTEESKPNMRGGKKKLRTAKTFVECPVCKKKMQPTSLSLHRRTHEVPKLKCHVCGFNFRLKHHLQKHLRNVHQCSGDIVLDVSISDDFGQTITTANDGSDVICERCNKACKNRRGFLRHIPFCKDPDWSPTCRKCGKSFRNGTSLKYHMIRHSGKLPHACNMCECAYAVRADLTKHVKRVHLRPVKEGDA